MKSLRKNNVMEKMKRGKKEKDKEELEEGMRKKAVKSEEKRKKATGSNHDSYARKRMKRWRKKKRMVENTKKE